MRLILAAVLSLASLAAASGALAQTTAETPAEARDHADHTSPLDPSAAAPERSGAAEADPALSDAEREVAAVIAQEGVHVVHFWAPWCHNSMNELRSGLFELIGDHPEVTFTFVAARNAGEDGAGTLERFGLPERVRVLAHPGASPVTFLGRPITWTPTTWVFNRGGTLAYAFNYGEVSPAMLTQAVTDAAADWSH